MAVDIDLSDRRAADGAVDHRDAAFNAVPVESDDASAVQGRSNLEAMMGLLATRPRSYPFILGTSGRGEPGRPCEGKSREAVDQRPSRHLDLSRVLGGYLDF